MQGPAPPADPCGGGGGVPAEFEQLNLCYTSTMTKMVTSTIYRSSEGAHQSERTSSSSFRT